MSDNPQTSSTTSPHVRVLLEVWFSFQIIGGHFLVPILVATFLLTKAKRDATLINLGVTLVLSSIFHCLLLYADQYIGPEPNKRLCIFQAAAFGASAPMCSVAALTLVSQIRSRVELKTVRRLVAMLVAPYVVFLVFLVVFLVVGSRRPDTVTRARRTFYCSMESRTVSLVSIGFTALTTFFAVCLGATMSYQLYNFLRMVRQARRPQIRVIPLAIRLVIFMIYIFAAFVTSLWSIRDHKTFIRDIYASTFGVAYFLVFGTQRDIFQAWCFWRKDAIDTRTDERLDERAAQTIDDITTLYGNLSSPDSVPSLPETGATHEANPAFPHICTPYANYTTMNAHTLVTSSTRTEA